MTQLAETLAGYRMNIRAAVRGLWTGHLDYDQFFQNMVLAVRRGFTQAWYEGAKEWGVKPNELRPDERLALEAAINQELLFIDGLGVFVESNSKRFGGKLGKSFARTKAWINRYNSIRNQAAVSAGGDRKMIWLLGVTEVHCRSCLKLHKKVKRASQWAQRNIQPQNAPNPLLECQGFLCDCDLVPTNEPMSRGPLPALP